MISLQKTVVNQDDGLLARKKSDSYRIVIDTSVLISALFFGGDAEKVLRHISREQEMVLSDCIIDEYVAFAKGTIPKTPQATIRHTRKVLEKYVKPYEEHDAEIRDVNDLDVIRLAIEYDATIVTGDRDILEHKNGAYPPVLSIQEYAELFLEG